MTCSIAQSQRPELESWQPSTSTGFSCPPHCSPDLSRLQEVKLACGGGLRSLQGWEEEPEVTSKKAKVTLDLVPLVIRERGRQVPLKGAVCMDKALTGTDSSSLLSTLPSLVRAPNARLHSKAAAS